LVGVVGLFFESLDDDEPVPLNNAYRSALLNHFSQSSAQRGTIAAKSGNALVIFAGNFEPPSVESVAGVFDAVSGGDDFLRSFHLLLGSVDAQ
jgi:hypothetical protein